MVIGVLRTCATADTPLLTRVDDLVANACQPFFGAKAAIFLGRTVIWWRSLGISGEPMKSLRSYDVTQFSMEEVRVASDWL